jgi:hypothetical protein
MFVTKKRFQSEVEWLERQHRELSDKYWELRRAHVRLLRHLGIDEVTVPEETVLRAKGGPEPCCK